VAKLLANANKGASSGVFDLSAGLSANPNLQIAEQQAALYLERLAQYEELAALDGADTRNRGGGAEEEVVEGGTWEHRKRAKEMLGE
jgi:hypothetical protein